MIKENETSTWVTHPWVAQGQYKIRFGVSMIDVKQDWSLYQDRVQMAEDLGFDSCWTFDHPMMGGADCWTKLTMLALTTKKMRLGSLVSCIYYRSPHVLARLAADVDSLSHGRLVLGLGIGDFPFEFAQQGIPWLSTRQRQEALEETIHVLLGLWEETPFSYQGKHFQVQQARALSGPSQQPRVPLLIAGGGERVTLRQVAQYADASNFAASPFAGNAYSLDDVARKYAVLHRYCEEFNRPYESVLRTHMTIPLVLAQTHDALRAKLAAVPAELTALFKDSTITGTPHEVIAHYQALVQAGVRYFTMFICYNDFETLRLLAEQVVPEVAQTENVSPSSPPWCLFPSDR